MIIPRYWAEARRTSSDAKGPFTVRRFGWSDDSQAAAQQHADRRADEALARIRSGERLERFEPRRAYNGAEGAPIREEIVAEHGGVVITRNAYGALCLNVADVLIADVDYPERRAGCTGILLAAALAGAAASGTSSIPLLVAAMVAALVVLTPAFARRAADPAAGARRRIDAFVAAHPAWNLRLYQTPAGLRLIAVHRAFVPDEAEVTAFFAAVGADPVYVRMCQQQHCFRARLTAKPWRIGIAEHMKPRTVWPVPEEHLPERRAWIANYERAAAGYASCRFLAVLGHGPVDPAAAAVAELHDRLGNATSDLPIA